MEQKSGHGSVEQSSRTKKKKSTSPTDVEDDAKRARLGVGNDDVSSEMSELDHGPKESSFYHKTGSAHSLHGNVYQLKLLMLFLYRAWKMGYEFNLGTEVECAAKFDDIVFKYKIKDLNNKSTMNTEVKEAIRFVQAKHRLDGTVKITVNDLLQSKNGDFSLQKYFISYRNIKNNPNFSGYELDDFILCTNIDLDDTNLIQNGINVDRNKNDNRRNKNDDILSVKSNKNTAFCKLIVPEKNDLYEKLRETSDLYMLAEELASHIALKKKKLILGSNVFKLYHVPLSTEVFNLVEEKSDKGKKIVKKYAEYRSNFLNGKDFTDLSENATNFRNALKSALKKRKIDELKAIKLEVSLTFGELFELDNNPMISEPENLAKEMANIIFKAETNIVTLKRTGIIRGNIDKLAGHILVKVAKQDDEKQAFIIFNQAFFNDNNSFPGNLKDFRNAFKLQLKKYHISFDQLKQYKFNINKFKTCEETLEGNLLLPKLELPNDKIEDSEIKSFLGKLVLAVNQPNVEELGDIIEQEMGEHEQFNFLNARLVAHSFQTLMLDWFKDKRPEKGKEGVWLDRTKGENFFNEIKGNIGNLLSTGLNLAYTEELRSYGIEFQKNSLFKELENFLSEVNTSKKIFHIITPEETRILSAIKIDGALDHLKEQVGFEQYRSNDSYIFMSLKSLLSEKTQEYVIKSFQSKKSHNLLIICCETDCTDDKKQDLYDSLSKILKMKNEEDKNDKKVILITDQNNKLVKKLRDKFINNFEDTEDNVENIKFCDLTKHSKIHILAKEVTFQGQKLNLNKLINETSSDEMIDAAILVKLMKDERIIIGSQVQDLGEVGDYYINRRIKKVALDKKKIMGDSQKSISKSDLFVIHGTGVGLKSEKNIYVFNNSESAKRKFEELRSENSESNIHWLKSDAGKITWCKSHGSISNLIPYKIKITDKVDTTNNIILSLEDIKLKDDNKIVIISDIAGMGKTIALTRLSIRIKEKDASRWVIKINLNDHTKLFDKERKNRKALNSKFSEQGIDQIVNFLLNDLLILQNQSSDAKYLEDKLFKNRLISDGKIVLLFDGFDEISPNYKDIVIDLMQSLEKSKVDELFITTRPNVSEDLERELGVLPHTLEPLSQQEMLDFLNKFWAKTLKLKNSDNKKNTRLDKYVKCIIDQISKSINDEEQQFIAIPLQTKMIAEIFQENQEGIVPEWQSCKEFLELDNDQPNLPKDFAVLDLYEHFVKSKFYKYYLEEKKHRDLSKTYEQEEADDAYMIFKKNHALLALHTLFNDKELKKMLKKMHKPEEIKKLERNQGIVDHIIDAKPHFIHRTYAEYFASFAIAEQLLENPAEILNCIENFLSNASPIFINSVIEQLNEKQENITKKLNMPLLHFVIKDIDSHKDLMYANFIKSLLSFGRRDWEKKLDSSGKTPLHYAVEYNHLSIVQKLLDYANDIDEKNILHHGSFKNPDYANSRLVKFINIIDQSGNTALYYAMQGESNHFESAFQLLLQGASIESLTNADVNRLINKMLSDRTDHGILRVSADEDSKYRAIQEKLFVRAPGIFKDLTEDSQSTILSYFFLHGRVEVIGALLDTINDMNDRKNILNNDVDGCTPLDRVNSSDYLSDEDRLGITKYLFEHGGIKTKITSVGYTIIDPKYNNFITRTLQASAQRGHIKTFQYFIAHEKPEHYGIHLRLATEYNQLNIIKCLSELFERSKEDIEHDDGNTALHVVCDTRIDDAPCSSDDKLKIIKHVFHNGIINSENEQGRTPLFMAIYSRSNLKTIKYLVSKGAYINHKDKHGETPLVSALQNDPVDPNIIDYFLKENACISEETSVIIKKKYAYFKNPNEYNINLVDENGFSRLHAAIKSSDNKFVEFLVRYGADVNKVDKQDRTPLHWAVELVQVEMVELLLQYGAFFDKKDNENKIPLQMIPDEHSGPSYSFGTRNYEHERNAKKIVWLLKLLSTLFSSQNLMDCLNNLLMQKKSKDGLKEWGPYGRGHTNVFDGDNPTLFILNSRSREEKTLLHIAADKNDAQAIHILLKFNNGYLGRKAESHRYPRYRNYQSMSIDAIDSEGNTPLHLAAQKGHIEVISLLLEKGAIFNIKNKQGLTPEDLATNHNHFKAIELFQSIKNLFIEAEENSKLSVEKCIENARYVNVKNQDGKTLLHLAIAFGSFDDVQLLLQMFDNYVRINIDAIDLNKNTPLHTACELDKIENVKLLLKYGVIYDAENAQNQKPSDLAHGRCRGLLEEIDSLFEGIQSDDPQVIIKAIRNSKTDFTDIINTRDNESNTLLHYAAKEDELEIVQLLLEKGAAFDAENNLKKIPANCTNDESIITLLKRIENMFNDVDNIRQIQNTVSLEVITNVRDDHGLGLLHRAADTNNFEMVNWLIKKGAKVNATDKYGHTVLHKIVESGNLEAVERLVEKQGANFDLIDVQHLRKVSQEIITYLFEKKQEMY